MTDPFVAAAELPALAAVRYVAAGAPPFAPAVAEAPLAEWIAAARDPALGLGDAEFWAREIDALGLAGQTTAVVYDDGRMVEAARVWFVLQHFGVDARILDGGAPALAEAAAPPAAPAGRGFVARPGAGRIGLVDREALRAALGGTQVFDARTEAEHIGADLRANPRGGRLPGAALVPHAGLMSDGRMRDPAALRAMMTAAGLAPGLPVATHCDGGGRAALAAAAALRAGFGAVSVYYLSFADWAADESCPIETPR